MPRPTRTRNPVEEGSRRKAARPRTAAPSGEKQSERSKLGRELHDGPAQLLVVALLQARALAKHVATGPVAAEMNNLTALICTALDDVRKLSHGLSPPPPEGWALRPALEEFAERSSNSRFAVEVHGAPPSLRELTSTAMEQLFRIAQSALGNVVRHARARRCSLVLSETKDRLRMQIDDDGQGFDPRACSGGLGLSSIHERAVALGGSCSLATAPGRGTSVRIEVPIRAAASRAICGSPMEGA